MTEVLKTEESICTLFQDLLRAWTRGDASAYGQCFTDNADYVSFDGAHARGRAAIVRAHDWLFRGVLAGSALVGQVEDVRLLTPEVALVHATGSVLMPWRQRLPRGRLSRQTLVAVNIDGQWLWASLHNTRVRPMHVPEPNALPSRAVHLLRLALPDRREAQGSAAPHP